MKLPIVSLTTFFIDALSRNTSVVEAGCPMAHQHDDPTLNSPHARATAAANEQSMKVHQTPRIDFKLPPKNRQASCTHTEGGVLVETPPPQQQEEEERRKMKDQTNSGLGTPTNPAYSNQNVGDGYAIPEGGYAAVRQDVLAMALTNTEGYWPADFESITGTGAHYGGLFIRLAWHCSGTYRISDGRGGCDGGSIRYPPVSQWADNASLNMALELLKPVKEKHGDKLSWGDLIVLAADAAMVDMGFPVIGFCGGRIDWSNGDQSLPLGPSIIQQTLMPCGKQQCPIGQICSEIPCESPLGAEFMGLIYVEPTGTPEGNFAGTAQNTREVFARMGFGDRMTVAAIGGGHAFGKSHGPCKDKDTINICNDKEATLGGRRRKLDDIDTKEESSCHKFCPNPVTNSTEPPYSWEQKFTSGLEVVWTRDPTSWDNEFFRNILFYNWTDYKGPAGHLQWKPSGDFSPNIQMFTTDLALAEGDPEYRKLSEEYANSLTNLTRDFGMAWYQLVSRDSGPRSRCLGDELPPIQPWEERRGPVVPLSTNKPDYVPIRAAIQKSIDETPSNVAAFSTLATQCASTFRTSDYIGGCNGAAIRFPPSIDWKTNKGASDYLKLLEPIKDEFPQITWSDLIVLAGQTAIESSGGKAMPFCGGRADSDNGLKSDGLEPRIFNNNTYHSILYNIANKGMSLAEGVALMATPDPEFATLNDVNEDITAATNRAANLTTDLYTLSNQFFVNLKELSSSGDGAEWFMDDIAEISEEFIQDNEYFLDQYAMAYNYMMTADLFDGSTKNACQGVSDPTLEGQTASAVMA